jgi:V8-like Glu-specific endopeptidase
MFKGRKLWLVVLVGCALGCSGEALDTKVEVGTVDSALTARVEGKDFTDKLKRKWRYMGKAGHVLSKGHDPKTFPKRTSADISEDVANLQELATKTRGLMYSKGYVYEAAADLGQAAEIQQQRLDELSDKLNGENQEPLPSEYGPTDAETLDPKLIFGTDNRAKQRTDTSYPWRTIIWITDNDTKTAGCTATLVGPSTAITAAHCFHTGTGGNNGFYPLRAWGLGVDSQDTNDFNWDPDSLTFPSVNATIETCYSVTLPGEFANGNTDLQYDYAVMEFSGCGFFPGNSIGWVGVWKPSSTYLDAGFDHYSYGYPGNGCPGAATCNFPQIWGHHNSNDNGRDGCCSVHYETDISAGQSGSGGWILSAEGHRYIIESAIGQKDVVLGDDWNYGRRMSNTYFANIRNFSGGVWVANQTNQNDPSLGAIGSP